MTWGNAACGGDSRAVQDQLSDVVQIQASASAFASILGNGSGVPLVLATTSTEECAADPRL